MSLTPEERRTRRSLDFVLMSRTWTSLWSWRAYNKQSAWLAGAPPITLEAEGARATFFVVEFRFPVLCGPGQFMPGVTVTFSTSSRDYPFMTPVVWVVSRPVPWNMHFSASGVVCLGSLWAEARGRMTLPQLVLHVVKLANFDEPRDVHGGYNAAALAYWATTLGYRPASRLRYPTLPTSLYDGTLTVPPPPPKCARPTVAGSPPAFRIL